jgi:hypothetical protein
VPLGPSSTPAATAGSPRMAACSGLRSFSPPLRPPSVWQGRQTDESFRGPLTRPLCLGGHASGIPGPETMPGWAGGQQRASTEERRGHSAGKRPATISSRNCVAARTWMALLRVEVEQSPRVASVSDPPHFGPQGIPRADETQGFAVAKRPTRPSDPKGMSPGQAGAWPGLNGFERTFRRTVPLQKSLHLPLLEPLQKVHS